MATRSSIARRTATGVESIYVHWDGYPDGVGATLAAHYTDPQKIDALFALGDLSRLGEVVDYTNRHGTVAYGRDIGEPNTDAVAHDSLAEWLAYRHAGWCEYGYFWTGAMWEIHVPVA
jgi:hypothetical protein